MDMDYASYVTRKKLCLPLIIFEMEITVCLSRCLFVVQSVTATVVTSPYNKCRLSAEETAPYHIQDLTLRLLFEYRPTGPEDPQDVFMDGSTSAGVALCFRLVATQDEIAAGTCTRCSIRLYLAVFVVRLLRCRRYEELTVFSSPL